MYCTNEVDGHFLIPKTVAMDTETLIKQSLVRLHFLPLKKTPSHRDMHIFTIYIKTTLLLLLFRVVTYSLQADKEVPEVLFESNIFSAALIQREVVYHINGAWTRHNIPHRS